MFSESEGVQQVLSDCRWLGRQLRRAWRGLRKLDAAIEQHCLNGLGDERHREFLVERLALDNVKAEAALAKKRFLACNAELEAKIAEFELTKELAMTMKKGNRSSGRTIKLTTLSPESDEKESVVSADTAKDDRLRRVV